MISEIGEHLQAVILAKVTSKEDLSQAESFASCPGTVIMDASDWQIIPAGTSISCTVGKVDDVFLNSYFAMHHPF